jgi:hypothetical protein
MSSKQMQQQQEEQKKHGDPLERALDDVAEHTIGGNKNIDPVPEPEKGNHAHSHAAHLGAHVNEHTKPAGNLRHGASPGALREPPQEVSRMGKQHRGQ